ncbi:MAG TPA: class I mannose-6-phosphate isomerase [Allosphingosinicella sp.]|nr:class I mannose-6-phosphate isomerase [Allosphingosinicella sp.]
MSAARLRAVPVERVWGRHDLPAGFPTLGGDVPVGEIWFEPPPDAALLVKYLFTAERLSIQVHPGDEAARAKGLARGKDEAWFILDAAPEARIGLGLRQEMSREALRAAALDGSIEALLDWRPVSAGELLYSPAGTIHAIGGGISLIEIQQNLDLTYRLYDYGRPRELHLEEGVAVAIPGPWTPPSTPAGGPVLAAGNAFRVERWSKAGTLHGAAVVVPLATRGMIDGEPLTNGAAWDVAGAAEISGDVDLLAAFPA